MPGPPCPRDKAFSWVLRSLALECGCYDGGPIPLNVYEYAESVFATAGEKQIETEAVINWIHNEHVGRDWNLVQFREWAERYCEQRAKLGLGGPPPAA